MKNILLICLLSGLFTVAHGQMVYTSEKGEKYHTADCKFSGDANEISAGNAKKAGKKPCEICKPDELKKVNLVQCKGKRKDGQQCKRMTANKTKKCYQHAGA